MSVTDSGRPTVNGPEDQLSHSPHESSAGTPLGGCLVSLIWGFGPWFLPLLAILIAKNDSGWFSPASLALWILAALIVGARYVDAFGYPGDPTERSANSLQAAHRFSGLLLAATAASWSIALAI